MKYLVLLAILLLVYLLWLHQRRNSGSSEDGGGERTAPPPRRRKQASPQEMVRCAICAVHLPRADALPDPSGRLYCCAEHRQKGTGE